MQRVPLLLLSLATLVAGARAQPAGSCPGPVSAYSFSQTSSLCVTGGCPIATFEPRCAGDTNAYCLELDLNSGACLPGENPHFRLTGMNADFDLYLILPSVPGCSTNPADFRIADHGGQAGTGDECEYLDDAEILAYRQQRGGYLQILVYLVDDMGLAPCGGPDPQFTLDVICAVGDTCGPPAGGMGCAPPCVSLLCGDCDGDGSVTIIDALRAAQISAGILPLPVPGTAEFNDCNPDGNQYPDPAAIIDILDALSMAQAAAGISVLTCC